MTADERVPVFGDPDWIELEEEERLRRLEEEEAAATLVGLGFEVVPASALDLIGWRVEYRDRWENYAALSVWSSDLEERVSVMTEHVGPTALACWDWIGENAARRSEEARS